MDTRTRAHKHEAGAATTNDNDNYGLANLPLSAATSHLLPTYTFYGQTNYLPH